MKSLLSFFAFLFVSSAALAQYPSTIHLEDLRIWLKTNTYNGNHSDLGYNEARRQMYSYTDEVNDSIYCIYTDFRQAAVYSTYPNPINAEHIVPQSLFGSSSPMRSDIHALRPSHGSANSERANFPFAEIDDTQADWYGVNANGTYFSSSNEPNPSNDFSEGAPGEFEPQEDRKGDVARQVFYFYTMYPTQAGSIASVGDIQELYTWHLNDPVDALEMQRNDRIEVVQGNRNPYIDYANLVYDAWLWEESNCDVFLTAPVDLTKSQQPVPFPNGVMDRVQVKWYKASPAIRYAAADSAACDIQFWAIRDLANNTTISNADTSLIPKRTKPGQEFFKWPVKFNRSDVDPLIRYRWRVRCYCEEGDGIASPWSETKIFNTPDFDVNTGIYTPTIPMQETRNALSQAELKLYPNPAKHQVTLFSNAEDYEFWSLKDVLGREILRGDFSSGQQVVIDLNDVKSGLYIIQAIASQRQETLQLQID